VIFLKGVYWDLDGTIANTELEAHLPAFNAAFKDFNLDWEWDYSQYIQLLKINGGKNRILYFSKINNFNIEHDIANQIHKRKQEYYFEIIKKNTVKLKTGIHRLVTELTKKKVRQFIVTSSSRMQVELLIEKLFHENNPFEFIISSDDVIFHKPDPFPYLKAIQLSGIDVHNSIVFEDSNTGLRSSIAANLPTIYTPSNIPTSIDEDIKLKCIIECLGNEKIKAKVAKGPKLEKNIIDYTFLNKFLMMFRNAEN